MRSIMSTFFITFTATLAHGKTDVKDVKAVIKDINSPVAISKKQLNSNTFDDSRWWSDRNKLCLRDELQMYEIERTILKPLRHALINKDVAAVQGLMLKGADAGAFAIPSSALKSINGIKVQRGDLNKTESFSKQLSRYEQIQDAEILLKDYVVNFNTRDNDYRFAEFEGDVEFNMRGLASGSRRMDKGLWKVQFKKDGNQWKIAKMRPTQAETLTSKREPMFREDTKAMGLDSLPVYARTEAIRRGGYALSMADVNGDGHKDLLVGFRDRTMLLLGQKNGGFKDATKGSGLEKVSYVKTAIFADLRNKGIQDLVVTLLVANDKTVGPGKTSVMHFQGDGSGKFTQMPFVSNPKKAHMEAMPAAIADFNGDGYLDLYVGYPGIRDFTVFSDQQEIKDTQGLYLNDKSGNFKDFTDHFLPADYARSTKLFPHSSIALDLDQQGGIDLLVADDRNNLSPVYLSTQSSKLLEKSEVIGLGNRGFAMSTVAGDVNNDGRTDIAMTNVNFNAAQRASKACQRNWQSNGSFDEEGLRLFTGNTNLKFEEITEKAKLKSAIGEGAAGLTFIDYNNDGLMDIYVVNGLWSGHKDAPDVASLFIIRSLMTHMKLGMGLRAEDAVGYKHFLRTFEGEIAADGTVTNRKDLFPNMLGFQRNRLLHNNGDGTFTDVAFFEGVDSINDGYVVGTMLNQNGSHDLVLRNGDPGTVTSFPVVQYYTNTSKSKGVILTFEGSKSNKDGFGTFVVADFGNGKKQVQHLIANSGSVQADRTMRFVTSKPIPRLDIHWPSGEVVKLRNVAPGKHHIREPSANLTHAE